jgi:eukaryotic-like serine/threonine-protein kinase
MPLDKHKLKPGSFVADRYEVGQLLGEGGFAAVYAGFDPVIRRDVAIKVLHSFLLGGEKADQRAAMLGRFRQEASSAASIGHPNVVNIFDMGVLGDDEQPFIVMERLVGHDLQEDLKKNGPMPPARLLPLFATALEAIGAAHKKGVVHRDLKPSNLFLVDPSTEDEDIRVVDFGIARVDRTQGLTATGQVVGTPYYLAPEYIIETKVTPALDVYQMGLILVELLTGARVVDGDNPLSCVHKHTTRDLRVPEALIGGPLGPLVVRALAFQPEERFADGRAFARALRKVDAATVPTIPAASPRHRLDDVSSSFRVAVGGQATTGSLTTGDSQRGSSVDSRQAAGEPVIVAVGGGPVGAGASSPAGLPPRPLRSPQQQPPDRAPAAYSPKAQGGSTVGVRILVVAAVVAVMALVAAVVAVVVVAQLDFAGAESPGGVATSREVAPQKPGGTAAPEGTAGAAEIPPEVGDMDPAAPADGGAAGAPKVAVATDPEVPAVVAPAAVPVVVEVVSDPAGATVYQGDKRLGKAPLPVTFSSADAPSVVITLKRRGYETETFALEPAAGPRTVHALTRRKKRPQTKGGEAPADGWGMAQ